MTRPRSPFGARLQQELDRAGMTQQTFADRVGVSQQTVSKWMTGDNAPRLRHFPRIEELVGVHPGTLSTLLFPTRTAPDENGKATPSLARLQRKVEALTPDEMGQVEELIDEMFHNRP